MNNEKFNEKLEEKISYIKKSLKKKASEYSPSDINRFSNFEKASLVSGESPEQIMFNYMLKHFVSYMDMLHDIKNKPNVSWDESYIKEKFGDIINYFILSEIYFLEHRTKSNFENNYLPF